MASKHIPDYLVRPTYSSEQLHQYYERISLPSKYRLDPGPKSRELARGPEGYEYLHTLQKYNLAAVPFENLDLHYSIHRTISIDPQHLFEKIVSRNAGRGGYCMELNGLFGTVLNSLGFDVYPTGARVNEASQPASQQESWPGPKYRGWDHHINIVQINGHKYATDVAFGGSGSTQPMLMDYEHEKFVWTNSGPQKGRLIHDELPDNTTTQKWWVYQVQNKPEAEWTTVYCFGESEFLTGDFATMNWFTSTHRDSIFPWSIICAKYTMKDGELDGNLTISGNTFKRRDHDGTAEVILTAENESQRVDGLKTYFGVILNEEEQSSINGTPSGLSG